MLSTRLWAQSVFQVNGHSLSAARSKTGPFSNYVHPPQNLGSMVKTTTALGRFERPGGCSVIHQGQQVLSLLLCWWPSTFRRSFSSPAKCSLCQNWRQHQCAVWDFFFRPENFLGHLTPPSVAGSEWRCKITISKSSFYVQSGFWSTLVQFKFALIFCKWRRSFWSKRILNHKWTACLILVSVSLLGADSLYTSAAECIYNWRGCYQIS